VINLPGKIRYDYEGAFHHIICRGNNGKFIFLSNQAKEKYLDIMVKYREDYGIKLLAYCMMDNHIHLLIKSGEEHIGKYMHAVQLAYSKWYHKVNKSYGQVFSGRYKNCRCDRVSYFYNLLRYIHKNPVDAGLVSTCSYRYSSYDQILSGDGIIDFDIVYDLLGDNPMEVFLDIMNRSEEVDIENAVKKLTFEEARTESKLHRFLDILDYDIKSVQGQKIEPYFKSLRQKMVPVIYSKLNYKVTMIAECLDVSEAHVYKLLRNNRQC
jgi:REP element-mobilizing transposase RayT